MIKPSTRPLKVFLCHSSGDKPAVRELYYLLCDEGWVDVWLDEIKLLPGQEWDIEIEKAVEEAEIVIVCLSNHSVDKEGYVQKELRYVLNIADEKPEGSIFVVPLRLDNCTVPRRLRHWQWVDYFPRDQKNIAYQRLMQSLKLRAKRLGIKVPKSELDVNPAMGEQDIAVVETVSLNQLKIVTGDRKRKEGLKPKKPSAKQTSTEPIALSKGIRLAWEKIIFHPKIRFWSYLFIILLVISSLFWGSRILLRSFPAVTPTITSAIASRNLPVQNTPFQLKPSNTPTITMIPATSELLNTIQPTPIIRVVDAFAGGGGVHLREEPNSKVIATLMNGSMLTVIPDEVQLINGVYWVHVFTFIDNVRVDGWVDQSVLVTVTPS